EVQIGVSRSRAHNLSQAWRILSLGHIQGGASASIVGGQTVPGNYNKLVPPPPPRPKVSQTASQPSPSTRPSYVPRFGRPAILVPDDFWSNLKQFLTERPVKVRERKDAPFIRTSFGAGLFGNLAEYFRPDPLKNRSEEHTSELQSRSDLVCRLLLEKKKKKNKKKQNKKKNIINKN